MESECRSGIQLHRIRPFPPAEMPFVKLEIVQCFGARQVYLHRLYLHAEKAEDIWRSLSCYPGCHHGEDRANKQCGRPTGRDGTRQGRPVLADVPAIGKADLVGVSSRFEGINSGHRSKSLSVSLPWSHMARTTPREEVIGYRDSHFLAGDSQPLGMTSRPRSSVPSGRLGSLGAENNSLSLFQGTAPIKNGANIAYQQQPHIERRDFATELRALDKLIGSPIVRVKPSSAKLQRPTVPRQTLKTHLRAPSYEERRVGFSSEGPSTGINGGSFFVRNDDDGSNARVEDYSGGVLRAADLRTSYPFSSKRENTGADAENDECVDEVTSSDDGGDGEVRRCSSPSTRDSAREKIQFRAAGIDPTAPTPPAAGAVLEAHVDRGIRMAQTGARLPVDDNRAAAGRLDVDQKQPDPTVISWWGGDMSRAHNAGTAPAWRAAATRPSTLRPAGAAGVFNEPMLRAERGNEALFPAPGGYESVSLSGGGDRVTRESHSWNRGVSRRKSAGFGDADDKCHEKIAAVIVDDSSPATLRQAVVHLHQKVRARQLVTARLELQKQLGMIDRSKTR